MAEAEFAGAAPGSPDIEVKVTCPDCGQAVRREASRVVAAELLARRVPIVSAV